MPQMLDRISVSESSIELAAELATKAALTVRRYALDEADYATLTDMLGIAA